MKNNFINQCLNQLKQEHVCYVYTEQQKDEVLKKCVTQNIEVKQNECGYTIKMIRKRVRKNE